MYAPSDFEQSLLMKALANKLYLFNLYTNMIYSLFMYTSLSLVIKIFLIQLSLFV